MRSRAVLIGLTAVLALAWTAASAQQTGNGQIFTSVNQKTADIFTNTRNILMIVGAIGVLGLAAMAFFGKFKWHWAVSLLGGLALIAFVSQVITYFGLTAPQ
jgi:type IV secretory pathway VirB2 component (pilin)